MRIIGGTARSMPLKTVKGTDTRPTTDRIKETLFNIIQNEVPGAVFLDLFAGSGGIGLEAVSRGARKAVFVDSSRKAAACIRENIAFTKFQAQSELKCMDFMAALRSLEGKYIFDIVFIDPPYGRDMAGEALTCLHSSSLCREGSMIIVEESLDFSPEDLSDRGFDIFRVKTYKTNHHNFMKRGTRAYQDS
ncbi:MAG: 16S rRNA (guanine(966)-N(2))-methyltransferase RsmD, partial [Lachnospiraceae bacterium]|nr:16S rRNA (guanine(966)-N(2))-methyltransferase RsmD [Lachnospiraceae bacterium]